MLAVLVVFAQQAGGAVEDTQPWGIHLSALTVQLVIGAALPLLVGIVTKAAAHPGVKAVLLALFTGVTALIVQGTIDDGGAVLSQQSLVLGLIGFTTAVATHFGVWRPTTVSSKLAPNTGIG